MLVEALVVVIVAVVVVVQVIVALVVVVIVVVMFVVLVVVVVVLVVEEVELLVVVACFLNLPTSVIQIISVPYSYSKTRNPVCRPCRTRSGTPFKDLFSFSIVANVESR